MMLKSVFFLTFFALGYTEGVNEVPKVFWPAKSPAGRYNSHDGQSSPETKTYQPAMCMNPVAQFMAAAYQAYELTSPNFPLKYPNNHNCSVYFQAPDGYQLVAYCPIIYLKQCDTMKFIDRVDDADIMVYDGDKLMGEVVVFPGNSGEIKLLSGDFTPAAPGSHGGQRKDKGFRCLVAAVPASGSTCYCGEERGTNRLIGGQMDLPYKQSWMVGLDYPSTSPPINCGGSLIGDRWVLTAARCIYPDDLKLRLGYWARDSPIPGMTIEVDAVETIIHQDYDDTTLANNIALVRFDPPLTWADHPLIRPVCLPEGASLSNDYAGQFGIVNGFGKLNATGSYPDYLQSIKMNILPTDQCQQFFNQHVNTPTIASFEMCALDLSLFNGISDGDFGTSINVLNGGATEQIGVASWQDGGEIYPSVFTRVTEFVPWINSHVETSTKCPKKGD